MKIAAAQIDCTLGDIAANVRKLGEFAARAKNAGAELIIFPEMSDTGYAMSVIRECATTWNDGAVPELRQIAKRLVIAIVCGVSERDGACIYNSQACIDAEGNLAAKYRKTHLFTPAPIEEHTCFTAGSELHSLGMGDFRFAMSICYDLRFPEVYRAQSVNHNANVFLISSAWPFPRVEHLRTLALARAIENQSYVVLSNRVGTDAGTTFCGSSAIIDPYGVLLAGASADREEIIYTELSREVLESVRSRTPIFKHRRPDLYQGTK
ncbi:MAG: carbon-nitrogen hydrolase family protein [Chthoniobacterales bacterium]